MASSSPVLLRATVDHRTIKVRTARHFIGLSIEYPHALNAIGNGAATEGNPVLAQLFQNITDAGNGTPVFRIGGGTTDESWWNPNGDPAPHNGINYHLTQEHLDALRYWREQSRLPLIIGLNQAANRPWIAVDWARATVNGLGREAITAFEIGNEPDLYTMRDYGNAKPRPQGWGFPDYLEELGRFTRRLKALRSWLPLAAPGACCDRAWDTGLPGLLRRFGSRISLVTTHSYLFCDLQQNAPLSVVLGDQVIKDFNGKVGPVARAAQSHGKRVRLTETAINACKGDHRFGYALWATDWLMNLSRRFVGADFHLAENSPFGTAYDSNPVDPQWRGSVSPLYYAMLLAARAIRSGSKVLPQATFGAKRESGSNARIWATIDRQRTIRVVAINKGGGDGRFVLRVPGGDRPGELQRLLGEDVSSREGVTLAGQSVPDSTETGELEGPKVIGLVQPASGNLYRFRMPAYSAALLTIRSVG